MSIVVRGMEMPKNCDVCRFGDWSNLHQTACCKLKDYDPCFSDFSKEYETQRSEICPLIALPDKHGRLVDADELWKELGIIYEHCNGSVRWNDAVMEIKNAPTIVEAEGNDE